MIEDTVQSGGRDARSGTRVAQVMRSIRQRIERRALTPGARLPSIRAMAEMMGLSKSTIVEAYDRLAAEGAIRSRPGSGFYVAAPLAPLALAELGPKVDRVIDPLWVLRQSLARRPGALKPGCGWLPESWMPVDAIRKGLRALARAGSGDMLVDYGSPTGSEALRRLIARRMAEQGVDAGPDQIMLTESGTHAIDLVCRFLIEPGDTVLVDDPCYFNFHALLRAYRAHVVGVPYTPTGPDVAAFADALERHRPRLYITNSALHNPTGATLSAATAHRVLKLAEAHDLIFVEDDIFADFEHEPAPRLAAFDGLDRVIRIGSFSKTLSASVRCGHIAARRDWIEALADLRIATGMTSSPLSAELMLTVLTDGSYRRYLERLRARLAVTMHRTVRRLDAIGIRPWIEPAAGMFLWCRLPDGIDAADVAHRALAEDIVLAPGNAFSLGHSAGGYLRFNVAQMSDERIFRVLADAMDARP